MEKRIEYKIESKTFNGFCVGYEIFRIVYGEDYSYVDGDRIGFVMTHKQARSLVAAYKEHDEIHESKQGELFNG